MTDEELIEMLKNDPDFKNKFAFLISEIIEKEMSEKSPDYNKIDHLSELYCKITGADKIIEQRSEAHVQKILDEARKIKPKRKRYGFKALTAAACTAILLFSANVVSVKALNKNLFEVIVNYTNQGFSVSYNDAVDDDDKYGIKKECAEHGISVEVPAYIPEGFELFNKEYSSLYYSQNMVFIFHNGNKELVFDYQLFDNNEDFSKAIFPSDHYNISEINLNGVTAKVSKEDGQYTLVYGKGNLLMTVYAANIPYDECDKIVESIK